MLIQVILKSLKKAQKSDDARSCPVFSGNMFHASWLLHRAAQGIQGAQPVTDDSASIDVMALKSVLAAQVDLALNLNHLQTKTRKKRKLNTVDEDLCHRYAFAFLQGMCSSKSFPPGFIPKLWKAYMRNYHFADLSFNEIPALLPRDVYLAASTEEFEEITQIITDEWVFSKEVILLKLKL